MRSYNLQGQLNVTIERAMRQQERESAKRAKRGAKRVQRCIQGEQYLTSMHTYQLCLNGKPEGDLVEMLGAEAKAQNDIFKQRFSDEINAAIDAGRPYGQTGAVSRHWKWVK